MEILLSIGFSITGFTVLLLLQKRGANSVNKFTTLILCLWFVRFLLFYLKHQVNLSCIPWLYFIDQSLFFLDGVLLFWFSKSLTKQQFAIGRESLHLIPFIVSLAPTISLFFLMDRSGLNQLYGHVSSQVSSKVYTLSWEEMIFICAIVVHNIIYLILANKNLRLYDFSIHLNYSTVDKIRLNWFRRFLSLWFLLLVLPVIAYFLNYIQPVIDLSILESILITSMVALATYYSFHSNNQLYANLNSSEVKGKSTNSPKKYDETELNEIFMALEKHMIEEKPYLDENLSLSILAEQIGVKSTTLSNTIKVRAKVNFYTYVNQYRVEQVKKELKSSKEQIIIIAYNNGFNSKSTFNKVFKDFTGYSPSEYRKNKTE
jgi:AraC-like DNA-binding protein